MGVQEETWLKEEVMRKREISKEKQRGTVIKGMFWR